MRDLRELPIEETQASRGGGWSFRLGLLTAGVLLAAALAGGAGWFAASEPPPPEPYDVQARLAQVNLGLETKSPKQLWEILVGVYKPMADSGFAQVVKPEDVLTTIAIERSRWYQEKLLVAAGVVLVLTIVAFAVAPKSD